MICQVHCRFLLAAHTKYSWCWNPYIFQSSVLTPNISLLVGDFIFGL